MCIAAMVVEECFAGFGADCTITSANDSKHGANSLHSRDGLCRALDFRTKDFPYREDDSLLEFVAKVKESLGQDFDVVLEDHGEINEHLHVEWDPK